MTRDKPDWALRTGVAGMGNSLLLVLILVSFPAVLGWTAALSVADLPPGSAEHTSAFVRFCLVLGTFLWTCFGVAWFGLRRRGSVSLKSLVGARWAGGGEALKDLGAVLAALVAMFAVGNLSNLVFPPTLHDSAIFRSMTAQNSTEALAFLFLALTAGFVEEVVFRGYLQRQLTALFGSPVVGSVVQVLIFTSGHAYQGWTRLVPVALIGCILTAVALWRRKLLPGMIAHGLGDGLVAFIFFARHL